MSPDDSDQLVRLRGTTVCDGIDAVENLGIIDVTCNSRCLNSVC